MEVLQSCNYNLRSSRKPVAGPHKKKSSCKSTTGRCNNKRSLTPNKAAPKLSTHDVSGYVSYDDEAFTRFDRHAKVKSEEQIQASSEYLSRKFARLATKFFNEHRNKKMMIPEYELIKPLAHEAFLSPTPGVEYHTNFVVRPKGKSAAQDMMFFAGLKRNQPNFFQVHTCHILGPVKSHNGVLGVDTCSFCDDILHPEGWGANRC